MNLLKKIALWYNNGLPSPLKGEDFDAWAEKYYRSESEKEKAIASRFIEILSNQLNVSIDYCTPESKFLDDLNMTDLEPVEVLMAVEEEFKIEEIEEEEAQAMEIIDDMIQFLTQKAEPVASGQRR
jgi:acyl carrier protein